MVIQLDKFFSQYVYYIDSFLLPTMQGNQNRCIYYIFTLYYAHMHVKYIH